jgi:methyl-accepting chemotaxis protein
MRQRDSPPSFAPPSTRSRAAVSAHSVTRVFGGAGVLVLAALLTVDVRWQPRLGVVLITVVATVLLRAWPIALTKYSSLTGTAVAALGGALVTGLPVTALGVFIGTLVSDIIVHRKAWWWGLVNAGREVLAIAAAYGWFALIALQGSTTQPGTLSAEMVPAISVYGFMYFVSSKGLQYFSLLWRGKLQPDERSVILRYEVIAFAASAAASLVILFTVANVGLVGWGAVALALAFAALLFTRIIDEAIAAEELNKLHEIELVVNSDASMAEALQRIADLANRLVDWQRFRISRLGEEGVREIYSSERGYHGDRTARPEEESRLQREARESGRTVVVTDAMRDARVSNPRADLRSMVVAPLRFGDRTVGFMEMEHHKRRTYLAKQVAVIERFARQLGTALQIQDLRLPLVESVARLEEQVDTLNISAGRLRADAESVARLVAGISRSVAEESEQAAQSRDVADAVHTGTASIARDAHEAARASERAEQIAGEHRDTIGTAIERLDSAKGFVDESTAVLGDLGTHAQRITSFIAVIKDLAEQTNLLALNAAIEAARAGDQGRGFAVVAEEIRRLAEESARASEDANQLVATLASQMERVTVQMDRGRMLVADVETLSSSAHAALAEILRTSGTAASMTRRIAEVSRTQERDVASVRERVSRIADISQTNRADASQVAKAAESQATAQIELEGATQQLRELALYLADLARRLTRLG